jgi:outer membrane receptor protein involved in Fe transport
MAISNSSIRKTFTLANRLICSAAAAAMAIVLAAGTAIAQDDDDEVVDEIIITGSRIPRSGFETLQPATVLDSEKLNLRGNISLAKSLNEQAGFVTPTTSPVSSQASDSVGQNFVDYLGLGQQRTLTLVNGNRFPAGVAPNGTGGLSVDLNAIPDNLVERIETIAIGGAPIYGSDAIAGTINIILRDDFEGLEFVVSGGGALEHNDAAETRFGATWGKNFDDGRGNITLSGQYTFSDGLKRVDRTATATAVGFQRPGDPNSPYAQELFNDLTVAVDNVTAFPLYWGDVGNFGIFPGAGNENYPNGLAFDINDPNTPISQFDGAGNLLPFVPGGGTGHPVFQNGGDGLKVPHFTALYTDMERYNFTLLSKYELTDSLRFKAEAWFARTDATELINQSGYNSPAFGGLGAGESYGNVGSGPIAVLIDNPFLLPATRTSIAAALDVVHDLDGDGAADPTIDTDGDGVADAVGFWRGGPLTNLTGANPNRSKRDTYRAVFGLEGDVTFGDRDFLWDVTYTYGRTESDDYATDIIQTHFDQAIQVVIDGNGNPACADPSGGCVPLDVIGVPTPEAVAYSTARVIDQVTVEQKVFSANIGGDIFDLPAGPIGAAVGFMYREESASYDPNDLAENGFMRDSLVAVNGEFDSTEFYAETVIPLLGGYLDTPLVDTLEFEGAIRFVDNSVAGNDTTWTAGLRYRPIEDIEFRGNKTESIRAPSITELFTPESNIFSFANDPCDSQYIGQGNVPATRAANCAADGIVQPFDSLIASASQQGTLSGNPNLVSEVAESLTFGVVLRPRFLKGFTASVDWFDIEIQNAIENLLVVDILNACYDSTSFPDESACSLFQRNATGQIIDYQSGFVNVGLVEFTGIQTVISYNTELGRFGSLDVGLNHLYTDKHTETPGSGNTVQFDGEIGAATHRVNLNATWYKEKWTVFTQVRWIDSSVFDNRDTEFSRNISGVGSWTNVDATAVYSIRDNIDLQVTIENLFDNDAPYGAVAGSESHSGIVTYFPGIRGRYATFTVRAFFE